jgi:hypothetical protein
MRDKKVNSGDEHTKSTPYFPILLLDGKDALEILDSLK